MSDRRPPDTTSGRGKECPICGRSKDADCKFSDEMAFCHHGSSLAPPSNLNPGDVITGHDGRQWAFSCIGEGVSGASSTFLLHHDNSASFNLKAPPVKSIRRNTPSQLQPVPIPQGEITLAPLSGAKLMDSFESKGKELHIHYGPAQVVKRISKPGTDGKPDKAFFAHHLNGQSPELTRGAGPDPWPLWHQCDLEFLEPDSWILEAEGETCCNYARTGGVVSISQPGHARSIQQRADRYRTVVDAGAAGIVYLADHDDQGRKYALEAQQAAAMAGLPLLVVHAGELHEDMPAGGSIDDLCRPVDHPRPGFGIPPAAAIELILEHARQSAINQLTDNHEGSTDLEPGWSDDFPPASAGFEDLDDADDIADTGALLENTESLAEGRKLFSLPGLLPPDLAAAMELIHKPLPTDDLSAVIALLAGYSGLLKLGTRVASSLTYSVPANLYVAMVMPSGGAKSSVKASLVDNPAKDIRKDCRRAHEQAMENWRHECQGLKAADRPPAPKPLFAHLGQYSPAALSRQLQLHEQHGLGLLLIRDEMSAMLKALAADTEHGSGAADGQLLEAFDGNSFSQILVGKDGAGEIRSYEECHLSVYGNIQPGILKELINGADPLGKFARFLCCRIPRRPLLLDGNDPTDEEWQRHQDAEHVLRHYASKLYSLPARTYRLSADARQLFNPWFRSYQERSLAPGASEVMSALWGKSSAHALRLAGNLHLLQLIHGAVDPAAPISASTINSAMAIVDQLFAETEAFHESPVTDQTLITQHIHNLAWTSGKPVSLTIAKAKGSRELRRLITATSFQTAIQVLVDHRYGTSDASQISLNGRARCLHYSATRAMAL